MRSAAPAFRPPLLTPLLLASLALLPLLAGCPPPYPKCNDDGNCASHGEVCVNGLCKECRDDSQCKSGYACQDGSCVRKRQPGTCDTVSDCGVGQDCVAHKCVTPAPDAGVAETPDAGAEGGTTTINTECTLEAVHFDFNDSALSEQSRSTLEKDADCIRQKNQRVLLEGNCDERGTEEYNLVLGEKRADSVERYLTGLGVSESLLKTVSYGKLRPKDPGHTEEAWAANRRTDLVWR